MKARNPSTGTLETVYVKALDSMPVGSQIEFSGDTIPTGWEEVNDYSTTEVNTGKKWIDGSPIYRIVLEGTTSSSSDQVELSAISAINYCVEIRGILYDNGYYLMIPSTGGTSSNYINCAVTSAKKPYIAYSSNYRNKDFKLIIEYTKSSS